jgi:hypothetical protein
MFPRASTEVPNPRASDLNVGNVATHGMGHHEAQSLYACATLMGGILIDRLMVGVRIGTVRLMEAATRRRGVVVLSMFASLLQ